MTSGALLEGFVKTWPLISTLYGAILAHAFAHHAEMGGTPRSRERRALLTAVWSGGGIIAALALSIVAPAAGWEFGLLTQTYWLFFHIHQARRAKRGPRMSGNRRRITGGGLALQCARCGDEEQIEEVAPVSGGFGIPPGWRVVRHATAGQRKVGLLIEHTDCERAAAETEPIP